MTAIDLTGQMLIAMPGMSDPRFARALICMITHDDAGAMGLIVNKPLPDKKARAVLGHLPVKPLPQDLPVHFGGPVETERGFVLHSGEGAPRIETADVVDGVVMSATLDSLEDIASAAGPARARLMVGYAGWGPGQLEAEIAQNGWLLCPATPDLVFAAQSDASWAAALASIGVDPRTLSAVAGRA